MESAAAALTRLCDRTSEVSAHYLVDETGTTYALVDEAQRAWHAGVAFWRGVRDLNSASIGIELVNPGHDFGYRAFPEAQITALSALLDDIIARHGLTAAALLGHSDIAPGRKIDPGELFPWEVLAAEGLGLWPRDEARTQLPPDTELWRALAAIGYATPHGPGAEILHKDTGARDVIAAFQRRFRPQQVDGVMDRETAARIVEVAALYA
jgi:N-acetylmuramoyl-L-alanine amidase